MFTRRANPKRPAARWTESALFEELGQNRRRPRKRERKHVLVAFSVYGLAYSVCCACVLGVVGVRRYRYAHTHIYAMSCKSILYIVYILCVRRIHIEYTWNMHVYVYCRCVHGFRGAEISKCIHTHTNKHTRTHTQ